MENIACTHDRNIPQADDSTIMVYENVKFTLDPGTVMTRRDPIPFEDFLGRFLPPARHVGEERDRGPGGRIPNEVLWALQEEFPWLTNDDLGIGHGGHGGHGDHGGHGGHGGGHGHGHGDHGGHGGHDPHDGERHPEPRVMPKVRAVDEAARIRERLLARREEWAGGFPDKHFYVRQLGGEWTAAFCGVEANACAAFPRAGSMKWCRTYKWPQQKGFYYGIHDGDLNCNMLAREWVRKADWFFNIWLDNGRNYAYHYTEEDLASCPENDEFINWACDLDVESHTFESVMDMREHATPTNPL